MDIATHALLGAASALALRLPASQARTAAFAGALGAMLPDADVFLESSQDPLLVIEYHRQFTHSFLIAPFGTTPASRLSVNSRRRTGGISSRCSAARTKAHSLTQCH